METVRQPHTEITYNGKNITADLSPYILNAEYVDRVEGESDELSITVEDVDALWKNEWYPTKGDKVQMKFGWKDGQLVDAGTFEIDEIEFGGPPDTVTIRAIAAGIKKALRTKNSHAYENQTLKQIAQTVASRNGLTVEGEIGEVKFTRVTQHREEDLKFLKRISYEFGYVFSVRDSKLIFTDQIKLQKSDAPMSVDRLDMKSYSFKDKVSLTYAKAKVRYQNPDDKELKEYDQDKTENADGEEVTDDTAADTLYMRSRSENVQQAELKAKAGLWRANSKQKEGSFEVLGNTLILAGSNVEITGFGELSGKYHICESVHAFDRSGYVTRAEVKRVGYVDQSKKASQPESRKFEGFGGGKTSGGGASGGW